MNTKRVSAVGVFILGLMAIATPVLMAQKNASGQGDTSNYYEKLAEECKRKESKGCCLASVEAMKRKGGHVIAPQAECPPGYQLNMLMCISSYRWCEPEPGSATVLEAVTADGGKLVDITLTVDAPFSTAVMTIQENGFVSYAAKQQGQDEIRDSITLTADQMGALAKLIEEVDFFDMKSRAQTPDGLTDGSTYAISIRVLPPGALSSASLKVYSVECYQFSCESNFLRLKDKITELWGKDILETGV